MKKIAIQGIKGSFHHIAALKYFNKESLKIIECDTFKKVLEFTIKNENNLGIIAIENSIVGGIIPNYILLFKYNIKIIGEIYITINQNLMSLPNQNINDLREIFSHPIALKQCNNFFNKYPNIKIKEYYDTAGAAFHIMKNNLKYVGAIAPMQASKEYKLKILKKNIQDISNNYTRFFIISNKNYNNYLSNFNKISIKFNIENKIGSLSKLLSLISDLNINISKIESIPIIETPWTYYFYIDLIINNKNIYKNIKEEFKKQKYNFLILGRYKNKYN